MTLGIIAKSGSSSSPLLLAGIVLALYALLRYRRARLRRVESERQLDVDLPHPPDSTRGAMRATPTPTARTNGRPRASTPRSSTSNRPGRPPNRP